MLLPAKSRIDDAQTLILVIHSLLLEFQWSMREEKVLWGVGLGESAVTTQ